MNVATTYAVSGMSCGHCVTAVTEEILKIAGVAQFHVALVPGGESAVVVTSAAPLAEEVVREAVDEAGYGLSGTAG